MPVPRLFCAFFLIKRRGKLDFFHSAFYYACRCGQWGSAERYVYSRLSAEPSFFCPHGRWRSPEGFPCPCGNAIFFQNGNRGYKQMALLFEGETRIPSGCAISGIFDASGRRMDGSSIIRSISTMHDRSNGLGSGFAGYGIYPEYQDFFSDMFGKTSVQVMKECTSPEQILEIPTEKLTQLLRKASRGRFTENKAKELKELASNSFAAMLSSDMATLLIRQMLEQIDLLEKQISEIEKIIAMQFAQFKTKLATIPGIGTTLGATILSEIGDINRFEKPKQLIAFAGMDPSIKQSGNFVGTESHMSKRGSPFLRRAVWLAAVVAVSHDPLFKYYFQQKMHSGKSYSQAMGFICHKLLNTIFAILKSGEDYNPVFPSDIDVSKFSDEAMNSQS